MADNTTANAGSGGDVFASDDIGGVKHQRVKVQFGEDGAATDVSATDPMPVEGAVTATVDSSALPTGAATAANQDTANTALAAIKTAIEILDNIVSGSEAQVDIVAALPAGDNNIGNVDLASSIPAGTNNIGDVDVLSIAAGDNNIGNVDVVTLPAIPAGTNNIGDVDVLTLPSIPAGNNNIGDVDIASALPAGTNAIGKLAANSGVDIGDVDVTSIAAGTNTIGDVGLKPRTSGALTASVNADLIDVDESETDVKTSAGTLFGWSLYNDGATEVYVKFYNATAANVTVGTTAPLITFGIPAGSGHNFSTDIGIAFSTAITIACTTGAAQADTGAPAANQVVGFCLYA